MAVKGDSHTWQTLPYVCSTRPVWRSQTELFSEWVLSASKNSGLLDMDDYVLQTLIVWQHFIPKKICCLLHEATYTIYNYYSI